jgi:hypothetical protein
MTKSLCKIKLRVVRTLNLNWYKMMIGSSLLMASFGFMVHSVSPAKAYELKIKTLSTNLIPGKVYVTG